MYAIVSSRNSRSREENAKINLRKSSSSKESRGMVSRNAATRRVRDCDRAPRQIARSCIHFFPVLAIRGRNFSRYYRVGRASVGAGFLSLGYLVAHTPATSLLSRARVSPRKRRFPVRRGWFRDDEQSRRAASLEAS